MAGQALLTRLAALEKSLRDMGDLAERAVSASVSALQNSTGTLPAASRVRAREIRASSTALSEQCLEVIATQQPVAADLRLVMAIQSLVVDLERIASHARSISRLCRKILKEAPDVPLPPVLGELAEQIWDVFKQTLEAFLAHDQERAQTLLTADSAVDAKYARLVEELLERMAAEPETLAAGLVHLDMAHKLERMGDRISNIAERAVWVSTGIMPGHEPDTI